MITRRKVQCPVCHGSGEGKIMPALIVGERQPEEWPPCRLCKGKGYIMIGKSDQKQEGVADAE